MKRRDMLAGVAGLLASGLQRAPDELEGMDPRDRVIATDVEVE